MSFGVTATGFRIKPLENILEAVESNQQSDIDPDLNQSADSVFGQVNGTVSGQIRELWEVAEDVYNSQYPDTAKGASQDGVASITGTTRVAATKSTVQLTVNLDGATVLPAGSVAHVAGDPTARFLTDVEVTASEGTGDYGVAATAETAGPLTALAGTITIIAQPVTGWNSVTNALDAVPGNDAESDSSLRLRREQEVTATGSSNIDAIRADLIKLDNIRRARVYENDTDFVDSAGRPPHSIEAVVLETTPAADDDEIAQAIWDSRGAGIETYSNDAVSGTAVDKQGNDQVQNFTRAVIRSVFIDLAAVTVDPDEYAGDTAVKLAVIAYVDALDIAAPSGVVQAEIIAAVLSVDGVINCPAVSTFLDFTASPSTTLDLLLGQRDAPDADTSNIAITTI